MATYTEDSTSPGDATSALTLSIATLLLSAASAFSLVGFSTAGNGDLTATATGANTLTAAVRSDLANAGGGASTTTLHTTSDLADRAAASDQLTGGLSAAALVSEQASTESWVGPITVAYLGAQGDGTSELSAQRLSTLDLASAGAATSQLATAGEADSDLTSEAAATSEASGWATLTADLSDQGLAASEASYARLMNAWVMDSLAASMVRYAGLPVTSLAWIGGKVIGLGDEGLYIHEGDLDGTRRINAEVLTGETRLGSSMVKSLGNLNVEYTATGMLLCRITCTTGTFTYELPARGAGTARGSRAITGRGLRSLYWQFRFTNVKGADFTITQATADNASSTNRRI